MTSLLLKGDAYELVGKVGRVQAVILDPPYLLSDLPPGKSHLTSLGKFESESYKEITTGFDLGIFEKLAEICDPFNMFCFCSNKQVSSIMAYHEAKGRIVTLLVWHKINAAPFANGVWRGDIEYVVHARDPGATFNGNAEEKKKVFSHPIVNDPDHPTVKPLPLIMRYVKICSNPGDTILDPFAGVSTTGVACAKMGRNFIGIEINEKHHAEGQRRIIDALSQPDLLEEYIPMKQEELF